jgi:hypothetical protein
MPLVLAAALTLPATPNQCAKAWLTAARTHPGTVIEPPPSCQRMTLPKRYEIRQGTQPGTADVYLHGAKIAAIRPHPPVAVPPSPAPRLTLIDKRHHFATHRWRRGGAEFVDVTQRPGPPPENAEESIQ